jgi:HlyD family secretion protein
MKKFFVPVVILSAAMLLLAACSTATPQPAAVTADAQPEALIIEGRVEPVNSMEQSFSIPGQIAEVLVKDGDSVEAGQVLARLNTTPEAQLALARAQQELLNAQQALTTLKDAADVTLSNAKIARVAAQEALDKAQDKYDADETDANMARLDAAKVQLAEAQKLEDKLTKSSGVDQDQQAAFEARLATAEAGLASAQAALDATELKATLAGQVVDVLYQVGQKVTAGQPVFTVVDFSSWVVKTDNLTEVDVVNVQAGQMVEVVLDALPGEKLSGEVTHINSIYEEKRGDITYTVTAKLTQPSPKMRWGMTAAVAFLP